MRFALICFPSEENQKFLSFTEKRSKFELGIGGRFRVVDFPLSLARQIDIRQIIFYQNQKEGTLQEFLQSYLTNDELLKVHLLQKGLHNFLQDTYTILKSGKIDAVIMYNADNPAVFNLKNMAEKFQQTSRPRMLFLLSKPFNKNLGNAQADYKVLFARKEIFLSTLKKIKDGAATENLFSGIMGENLLKSVPTFHASGFFGNLDNIADYYNFNMRILEHQWELDPVFNYFKIGSYLVKKGSTTLENGSFVHNSIISENCTIKGIVVNSIIFPGVHIGKESEIVHSVIFPNNRIGDFAKVYHSIIEETESRTAKDNTLNVGDYCLIGKMENRAFGSNVNYPEILKDGLTVIGRNCSIPRKVKIGANCYISPETNNLKIKMYNRVMDGVCL